MLSSRYRTFEPLNRERLNQFVALNNLTSQVPLIELVRTRRKMYVRVWVAYDPTRTYGTYVEIHENGGVYTKTVCEGGKNVTIRARKPDHV
jgi:hypothetical protein